MSAVARHIEQRRIELNMTQDTLADKLSVSNQTVSEWESGQSQPDIDTLVRIAEVLQTDANGLIYGFHKERNRKGAVQGLILSGGIVLLTGLGYSIGLPIALKFSGTYYVSSPVFLMQLVVLPLFLFFVGWTILQALFVCGLLNPLRKVGKAPFYTVMGLFLLLFLPILLIAIQETIIFVQQWYCLNHPSAYSNDPLILFSDSIFQYCYSFFRGWRRPFLLVCSFLFGVALWLTKPRKKPRETLSSSTEDNLNPTSEK